MSDVEKPWVQRKRSGPPSSCPVCGAATSFFAGGPAITCRSAGLDHFEWWPDEPPVVSVASERAGKWKCSWCRGHNPAAETRCRFCDIERPQSAAADNRRYDKSLTTDLPDEVWVGTGGRVDIAAPPLTADVVARLPEGAKVTVIWTGGNGPHNYTIAVDDDGTRCAWTGVEGRMRRYNPLRFIGQERFHTRVWLRDESPATSPDVHIPGCPALNRSGDCTCAPLEGELLGVDYRAACAGRLSPDVARFASLHRPIYGRPVRCAGCVTAVTNSDIPGVTWPCQTAWLALEMMNLTTSDIAITEE